MVYAASQLLTIDAGGTAPGRFRVMDADRFDSLSRSLAITGSRRLALTAALGGALGLLGLTHPDDATAGGKCKPTCNECQTCTKGPCTKTPHGKKCKKDTCQAKGDGAGCSVGTCQSGSCVTAAPPQACREAARRNLCPITGTCMENCLAGTVFVPESCTCQ